MIQNEISFPDFVAQLFDFNQPDSDNEDDDALSNRFSHLALSGQLKSQNNHPDESTQFSIHLEDNRITEDISEEIESVRDYDSLIGFTDNLPYAIPLSLHLIPQSIHQIKRSLHAYVDRDLVEPMMV